MFSANRTFVMGAASPPTATPRKPSILRKRNRGCIVTRPIANPRQLYTTLRVVEDDPLARPPDRSPTNTLAEVSGKRALQKKTEFELAEDSPGETAEVARPGRIVDPVPQERKSSPRTSSPIESCSDCRQKMFTLRYECLQCRKSICPSCHEWHPTSHTSKALFRAGAVVQPRSRRSLSTERATPRCRSASEGSRIPDGSQAQIFDNDPFQDTPTRLCDPVDADWEQDSLGQESWEGSDAAIGDNARPRNRLKPSPPSHETVITVRVQHEQPIEQENFKDRVTQAVTKLVQEATQGHVSTISIAQRDKPSSSMLDFDINLCVDPKRTHHAWSKKDREQLLRLVGQGYTADSIATRLHRSASAVSQQ